MLAACKDTSKRSFPRANAAIAVLRWAPDLLLTDIRISCILPRASWSEREQGPVHSCMVNLEPRRPHPVTGHTHTELYVVCGICGLCLLFLALAFVDTRKRMSVRKRLLGEKLA